MSLEKNPATDATFRKLEAFRAPWWTDRTNLVARSAVNVLLREPRPLVSFNLRLAYCDPFLEAAVRGFVDMAAVPVFAISEAETQQCGVSFELLRDRVSEFVARFAPRGYPFLLWGDHIQLGATDRAGRLAQQAIDLGFSGFQADGSHAFPDDIQGNATITASVVGRLKEGQMLEGEINAIGSARTTSPQDAETFLLLCRENKVPLAWLAIQNGTRHGPADAVKRFVIDVEGSRAVGEVTGKFGVKWCQHGSSYSAPETLVWLPHIGCGKVDWATEGSDAALLAYPELEQAIRRWCDDHRDRTGKPAQLKEGFHAFRDEFEHLPARIAERVKTAVYTELVAIIGIAGASGSVAALLAAS